MLGNWLAITNPFFTDNFTGSFGTDITDEGDHYEMTADLPGFQKEDIKVQAQNGVLTISAERHSEAENDQKKDKFLRQERSYGCYQRSFSIGDDIDKNDITAKYEDGVLHLTLPKAAKSEDEQNYVTVE